MPLKIIGAGLGRTGTLSVKIALEQLGFGPCYHMVEVFKLQAWDLWYEASKDPAHAEDYAVSGFEAFWKCTATRIESDGSPA